MMICFYYFTSVASDPSGCAGQRGCAARRGCPSGTPRERQQAGAGAIQGTQPLPRERQRRQWLLPFAAKTARPPALPPALELLSAFII